MGVKDRRENIFYIDITTIIYHILAEEIIETSEIPQKLSPILFATKLIWGLVINAKISNAYDRCHNKQLFIGDNQKKRSKIVPQLEFKPPLAMFPILINMWNLIFAVINIVRVG